MAPSNQLLSNLHKVFGDRKKLTSPRTVGPDINRMESLEVIWLSESKASLMLGHLTGLRKSNACYWANWIPKKTLGWPETLL